MRQQSSEGSRRERIESFWSVASAEGGLWTWADKGGIVPWEDAQGHLVLALWVDAQSAVDEANLEGVDAEGAALFVSIEQLLNGLRGMPANDIKEVAIQPAQGRFLTTLTVQQAVERITGIASS